MKKGKIVKIVVALTLAGGITAGVFSIAKKNENEKSFYDENNDVVVNGEVVTDGVTQMETLTPEEETKFNEFVGPEQEPVGQIEVYRTIDFTKVTNPREIYELLLKKRTEYYNVMSKVCSLDALYNDAERAAAVYNIVRIDNDLSGLMVKISEQKRNEIQNDYLDVQVEKLESLLNEINTLRDTLEEAENVWRRDINKVEEIEAEKILRVKKYNDLALKQEIKKLEKQLKEAKAELAASTTVG